MSALALGYNLRCNGCGLHLNADGITGMSPTAPGFELVSQARAFANRLPENVRWRADVADPRLGRTKAKHRHDYCPTCKETNP